MNRDFTSEPTKKCLVGQLICCSKCGTSGGTLVKVDDRYEHQDKAKCRIMQLRRR